MEYFSKTIPILMLKKIIIKYLIISKLKKLLIWTVGWCSKKLLQFKPNSSFLKPCQKYNMRVKLNSYFWENRIFF